MAHCDVCCLRLSPNRDKTLPRHYLEDTEGWFSFGLQKVCPGSGTTRYVRQLPSGRCNRPLSGHKCPCCGRRPLTLNKNGKFPKHNPVEGGTCQLSESNSR